MFFITGDEYHLTGLKRLPLAIAKNFALTGIDEHFMLPSMGMPWSMPARGNLKDPHIEIIRPVILAEDHAGIDGFGLVVIKMSRLNLGILLNFHYILLE